MNEEDKEDKEDQRLIEEAQKRAAERFEVMKQRAVQRAREYVAVQDRPIGLPKFMWDRLETQANELSMTPSELVRVWLADRLGGEK